MCERGYWSECVCYGYSSLSPSLSLSTQRLRARKASLAELQAIHSENHVRLYGRPSQRKPGQDKKGLSVFE